MTESPDSPVAERERARRRRRRIWLLLGVVVLVAALLLTPPLVNVSRLERRISASMSESLGRPVHMDRVTLNLLPMPGFTIENLVVSEDPSFGSEPVIRANTVTASLRVSSLWRRQVEFGTIRFGVDSHGSGPSVNLVRRADGRWNLENILVHASQRTTAPTDQRKAGPAPRFPYIEATGARVNIKLGNEKLPYSLNEADFALWLPQPDQWRVRLVGKPVRTDTNVSDTGELHVEATLERAAKIADVPVDLTLDWRRAPLGEASRVFTAQDMGWRGSLELQANAHGTLGDAALNTTLKLTDVRRSAFIPPRTLNVIADCRGRFAITTAVITQPACDFSSPDVSKRTIAAATADELDLTGLKTTGLQAGATAVPSAWLLDWARLFSERIPADLRPKGEISGSVTRSDDSWSGGFNGTLELPGDTRTFAITDTPGSFVLTPVNIAPDNPGTDKLSPLMLGGTATMQGYTMTLTGSADADELAKLRSYLPPLGDGMDSIAIAGHLDVTCTRNWASPQVCAAAKPVEPKKPSKHSRR